MEIVEIIEAYEIFRSHGFNTKNLFQTNIKRSITQTRIVRNEFNKDAVNILEGNMQRQLSFLCNLLIQNNVVKDNSRLNSEQTLEVNRELARFLTKLIIMMKQMGKSASIKLGCLIPHKNLNLLKMCYLEERIVQTR